MLVQRMPLALVTSFTFLFQKFNTAYERLFINLKIWQFPKHDYSMHTIKIFTNLFHTQHFPFVQDSKAGLHFCSYLTLPSFLQIITIFTEYTPQRLPVDFSHTDRARLNQTRLNRSSI